jgi:murein DD-endopeptidase MepM/ murein hydrolase activator NlpD
LHGRLRRIRIPHLAVYAFIGLGLAGSFRVFRFAADYARMWWKVDNYNALRREADGLQSRYQNLQKAVSQTNEELASLQLYAREVSIAYGIKQRLEDPQPAGAEGNLLPSLAESVEEYNFLKNVNTLTLASRRWPQIAAKPDLWPVEGPLMASFGERADPFTGEGEFHKGVDIRAAAGTPVRAAADGVIVFSGRDGGYGRLVIVDHGGDLHTYYAHLSRFDAHAGRIVRRGEVLGEVGSTGRSTAPHLHYEVRVGRAPVNPYRYLPRVEVDPQTSTRDFPF